MSKRSLRIHLFLASIAILPVSAWAQDTACQMDYELIFELREAEFGSYNMWDAVGGSQDKLERFKSGLVPDSGNTLVAGEQAAFEDGPPDLLLTEFDRRGRIAWEKALPVKDLEAVVKILPAKEGYVVVANKSVKDRRSIWLGFIDAEGKLKSEQAIRSPSGSLQAHDMIVARDVGKGYVLAASHEGKSPARNIHSILYYLDRNGKVILDHGYEPGSENRILGIDPTGKDEYLATGYIYAEDGRKAGWIMKLANDGSIEWQRQYSRGRAAELAAATDFLGKFIAVTGTAEAAKRGSEKAGWLMVIGAANGEIGWQRYYTGGHDYEGRDIMANEEGLISVMLQGIAPSGPKKMAQDRVLEKAYAERVKSAKKGEKIEPLKLPKKEDFVRLMTVNPRGGVFISDEYFNGEGAQAWQMILGPVGERILIGESKMLYQIETPVMGPLAPPKPGKPAEEKPETEAEEKRTLDGWVAAAAAIEPYEDPCIEPYSFLP